MNRCSLFAVGQDKPMRHTKMATIITGTGKRKREREPVAIDNWSIETSVSTVNFGVHTHSLCALDPARVSGWGVCVCGGGGGDGWGVSICSVFLKKRSVHTAMYRFFVYRIRSM